MKLRVPVTDELANGSFNFCIAGDTLPTQCLLQNREEVEVAGHQVGTVGQVVQALPAEGGGMTGHCCRHVWSHVIVDGEDS